jgi:hypothetical protein
MPKGNAVIETFSFTRQFGGLERPDVDKIDGFSPVMP